MILDIDAGNSRLKWVVHSGDVDMSAGSGWVANADIVDWLHGQSWPSLCCVRLASVAEVATEQITRWAESRGVALRMARVVDGVGGVRCGYREPQRLGVDRWLALLAARQQCRDLCLVVDAGTALTVDVLDENGVHEGGYIAPGLQLMTNALGGNTWGVRVAGAAAVGLEPGGDTRQAVGHGCLAAAVGMVAGIARSRQVTRLLLTGGDAPLLREYLSEWLGSAGVDIAVEDHLVLRGVGVALPWSPCQ